MTVRNIFVVDDEEPVRVSLMHLLSAFPDTEIHCFASGDAFLAEAQRLPPGCLILDMDMPGTSGLGVLEALAGARDRFSSVVLTGAGDVDMAVKAVKLGAVDFLEKPFDYLRLCEAIEGCFTQQAETLHAEARRAQARAKVESLSRREREVLIGLMNGRSNKLIAHELEISHRTIEIYRAKLMEKLEVRNLADALRIVFAAGLYPEQ